MCVCVCVKSCFLIYSATLCVLIGLIASPQTDAIWRGVLCLRKMASAVWGMSQHRDPGRLYFRLFKFSSLSRSTNP